MTGITLCHLNRSPVINDLLASLDFHPLSVDLLARAAFENDWDESKLVQGWNDNKTSVMKADNSQSLEAAIESALASPTIAILGPAAHATLEAFAAFPGGVKETRLGSTFPAIRDVAEVIDVLCNISEIVQARSGRMGIAGTDQARRYQILRSSTIYP